MAKEAPKLIAAGYTSLEQLRRCTTPERERIVTLFPAAGHRLKVRVLLDELCKATKPTPAVVALSQTSAKPKAVAPPINKQVSIPPPPPPLDDEEDEDDKLRASVMLSRQALIPGDDSDEEANRTRALKLKSGDKPKPKPPALPRSTPATTAASPTSISDDGVAADDDEEDPDTLPPPPAPVVHTESAEEDYDPSYTAPYLPQNLPELPDSDNEGPSEEDDELGSDISSLSSLKPRSAAGSTSTSLPTPIPGTGKKPARAATGPISTTMGVPIKKQLPAPPPARTPVVTLGGT
jgi:hypothetical protein